VIATVAVTLSRDDQPNRQSALLYRVSWLAVRFFSAQRDLVVRQKITQERDCYSSRHALRDDQPNRQSALLYRMSWLAERFFSAQRESVVRQKITQERDGYRSRHAPA